VPHGAAARAAQVGGDGCLVAHNDLPPVGLMHHVGRLQRGHDIEWLHASGGDNVCHGHGRSTAGRRAGTGQG